MLSCDASLAVELSLDRIGDAAGVALGNEALVAPPLLWSEVPSVLHELAFRGEISSTLGDRALRRFLNAEVPITEQRPEGLSIRAWRLASDLGRAKTYDAEYLALAGLLGCRLVTLDMRLRRGGDRLGFVLTPSELADDVARAPREQTRRSEGSAPGEA